MVSRCRSTPGLPLALQQAAGRAWLRLLAARSGTEVALGYALELAAQPGGRPALVAAVWEEALDLLRCEHPGASPDLPMVRGLPFPSTCVFVPGSQRARAANREPFCVPRPRRLPALPGSRCCPAWLAC